MNLLTFSIFASSINNMNAFEDIVNYSTVQIRSDAGSGTGFIFNFDIPGRNEEIPCLITNKHVIRKQTAENTYQYTTQGQITFHLQNVEQNPENIFTCDIAGHLWKWIEHPGNIDLCALPLGPLIKEMHDKGIRPYWRHLTINNLISEEMLDQLTPINNILMVGYPIGLIDYANNFPIFRKGITSTHPGRKFNSAQQNESHFLIDAACWPGSSGSPVFLRCPIQTRNGSFYDGGAGPMNNKLLGILWGDPEHTAEGNIISKEIPMIQIPLSQTRIPANLGFVIHAREILVLKEQLLNLVNS